jgi:adenylate kinase family enzyme
MQRILIFGDSNAGKSTLGTELAARLGLRFVELDALYWLPGWQGREPEEFRAVLARELPADGAWVAAGNYMTYHDTFWPGADTGIWLDLPLRITLPRLVRRAWGRSRSRELLWGTNYDRFWPMFKVWDTDASLLSFTIKWHGRRRRLMEATLDGDERWAHIDFVRLRSPSEVRAWLDGVQRRDAEDAEVCV